MKGQLQELQWSTDMQIGKILTEEQKKEYQKLREEKSAENSETHGRGFCSGRLRGF